jgi:hypothetical protein
MQAKHATHHALVVCPTTTAWQAACTAMHIMLAASSQRANTDHPSCYEALHTSAFTLLSPLLLLLLPVLLQCYAPGGVAPASSRRCAVQGGSTEQDTWPTQPLSAAMHALKAPTRSSLQVQLKTLAIVSACAGFVAECGLTGPFKGQNV